MNGLLDTVAAVNTALDVVVPVVFVAVLVLIAWLVTVGVRSRMNLKPRPWRSRQGKPGGQPIEAELVDDEDDTEVAA